MVMSWNFSATKRVAISILVSAPDLYEVSKMMDEVGRMMGSWEDQPPDLHEMSDEQLSALKSLSPRLRRICSI